MLSYPLSPILSYHQTVLGAAEVRTTWDRLSCCFSIVLSRDANTQTYNNAALDEDNNDEDTPNNNCISSSVRISSSSSHRSDGRGRPSKIEPSPTNGNVSFEMNPIDDDFSAEQKTGQAPTGRPYSIPLSRSSNSFPFHWFSLSPKHLPHAP